MGRTVLLLGLLLLPVPAPAAPPSGTRLCEVAVPLDGTAVATPPLRASEHREYRLVVRGTFASTHDGRTYDARYSSPTPAGDYAESHPYVKIEPSLTLLEEDKPGHRYVYAVPPRVLASDRSVSVGLDLSRFVDAYLITPSEVRAGLSGGLTVELWERRPPPPLLLVVLQGMLLIGAAAAASVGLFAFARARDPIGGLLRRIDRAHAAAAREAGKDYALFSDVLLQLDELQRSGHSIAQEGRAARRSTRQARGGALRAQIAGLERQLATRLPDGVRQELETTLIEKRTTLATLDAMQARWEHAVVRLRKIEGVLEAAAARIREARLRIDPDHREDEVIEAFRGELTMVRRAIDDVRGS